MTSSSHDHSPERRVAVRWQSKQQTSCHFATLEKISSRWAEVLNVSSHGIGLKLPSALESGNEVLIELPCKNPGTAKVVAAFVVHSNAVDGGWAIGCTFARPLSQEELDALV